MASYVFYAYAPGSLLQDPETKAVYLDPDFEPSDRLKITIYDDDIYFDGDRDNPDIGEDKNQEALVETMDGEVVAKGMLYDDIFYVLQSPSGGSVWMEQLEIGGEVVGYFTSEPLEPGVKYPVTSSLDVDDDIDDSDTRLTYDQIRSVPCFGSATVLETVEGPLPIEWLAPGHRVLTRDAGPQPVIWVDATSMDELPPSVAERNRPVTIPPDALGPGMPTEPVVVSPQHRLLYSGFECELYFASHEVFVAAKHLIGINGISQSKPEPGFEYHHVALPAHHIVETYGLPCESLLISTMLPSLIGPDRIPGLRAAMRQYGGPKRTARRCLKAYEARLLRPPAIALPHARPVAV